MEFHIGNVILVQTSKGTKGKKYRGVIYLVTRTFHEVAHVR